jgi:hypothetical protein
MHPKQNLKAQTIALGIFTITKNSHFEKSDFPAIERSFHQILIPN